MGGQVGAWKNRGEGGDIEHTLTLCCLQERRKQQRRLFDAQQIQREMSWRKWAGTLSRLSGMQNKVSVMLFLLALCLAETPQQLRTVTVLDPHPHTHVRQWLRALGQSAQGTSS